MNAGLSLIPPPPEPPRWFKGDHDDEQEERDRDEHDIANLRHQRNLHSIIVEHLWTRTRRETREMFI